MARRFQGFLDRWRGLITYDIGSSCVEVDVVFIEIKRFIIRPCRSSIEILIRSTKDLAMAFLASMRGFVAPVVASGLTGMIVADISFALPGS
jgi:hypothetical protein